MVLVVKNLPANGEDAGLIPGLGRSLGVGNRNPLQYPCLENFMDRGAWQATIHGVTKSWTQLSIYVEKERATHSSILVWEISWTEEPGRLRSRGSQRVRHDLATK